MKYSEIINEVKNIYPNEYEDTELIKWLEEAENVICVFEEKEPLKIKDLSGEATLPAPYDRMYIDFVCANISLHQHDDAGYARYISMYNARYSDFCKWYLRTNPGKDLKYKNWI